MSTKVCVVPFCRTASEKEQGQKGFFRLPSLAKRRDLRQQYVTGAGLPEIYMQHEGDARICFRHFHPSCFDTTGGKLTLQKGTLFFI